MDDVRLRFGALIDARVPAEVEHVLLEARAEAVEDAAQPRVTAVGSRRVRRPVSHRDDELDRRAGLGLFEDWPGFGGPILPGGVRVGLRVGDEAGVAVVEPRPVLAAAASLRSARR